MSERTLFLPPGQNGRGDETNYRLTVMVPKRRFLSCLRERWWIVLACLVFTLSAVLVVETIRTPMFSSFAQLYLSSDAMVSPTGMISEESQNYFGTQIELLKSARLQGAVYERLNITLKPGQKPPVRIDVVQPLKTSLLNVQATGSDPGLVQRFLQTLIAEYLAYKKETRLSSSQDLLISMTEQVARKDKDLQTEQEKLTEFQKTNNVAVLEEEGKSAGLYLADLNLQLAKFKLEQKLLRQKADSSSEVLSVSNSVAASAESGTNLQSTVTDDTSLKSARVELAMLLADKENKVRSMGERRFQQETERLQKLVSILEEDGRSRKSVELQDLENRISAIETAIPSWEKRVLDVNDRLAQAQRLKNNVQREQGYYEHLLSTLQNVDLNKTVQQERLAVLQSATSGVPEKRNLALRIALAIIAGVAMSLGLVFVWHLLDDRFVSVRDVKDQFGETVFGLVPQVKGSRAEPRQMLLKKSDPRQAYVESFRHLRSALLLSSIDETEPRILLITSAGPAEGKTTVAVNLARVLAMSGRRVALVNIDPYSDTLHRSNNDDSKGVFDYLRGEAEMQSIIRTTEIEGLSAVQCGADRMHGEELFLTPRWRELVNELRAEFDFVIVDSAPILASDDAALVVPYADLVIMVTRPFHTRSHSVRRALDMLYQRQAKEVGIVFNCARPDDLASFQSPKLSRNGSRNGAAVVQRS